MKKTFFGVCESYVPVVLCLCSLALINDGAKIAPHAEALRCLFTASLLSREQPQALGAKFYFYLLSGLIALINAEWLRATKEVNKPKTA